MLKMHMKGGPWQNLQLYEADTAILNKLQQYNKVTFPMCQSAHVLALLSQLTVL